MPWFKVDDGMHKSRKRIRLGRKIEGWAALGLWTHLGSWSADELTEGFVSDEDLEYHAPGLGEDLIKRLEAVGLVERVTRYGNAGWLFHDWDDYQPSKEEVLADRAANAARQKRWREKAKAARLAAAQEAAARESNAVSNGGSNAVTNAPSNASVTVPPTRPDPTYKRTTTTGPSVGTAVVAREPETPPESDGQPGIAEKIIKGWIGTLAGPPQRRIVDRIGEAVAEALRDGCAPGDVSEALTVWQQRGNLGAGVLPSLIHEISNRKPGELVPFVGRASPGQARPSTTDDRVRNGLALAERLDREDPK